MFNIFAESDLEPPWQVKDQRNANNCLSLPTFQRLTFSHFHLSQPWFLDTLSIGGHKKILPKIS